MSQIVTYILVILIWDFLRLSAALFANPDLSNTLIPVKWREMCGYQSIKIQFIENFWSKIMNCIVNSTEARQILGHNSMRYTSPQNRIFNGTEVKYRESPWTVQLTKRIKKGWFQLGDTYYGHSCTGVLITMQHILTAAHCLNDEKVIRIYAGSDLSADGWYTDEFKFYQHPNYTTGQKNSDGTKIYDPDFDIGVIVLEKPIEWERYGLQKNRYELFINTICLPLLEFGRPFQSNYQKATIFGWGQIKGNNYPDKLQKADIQTKNCCGDLHFELDFVKLPRMCKGDSGSGLVQYLDESRNRAVLIGILIKVNRIDGSTEDTCDDKNMGSGEAIRLDVPHIMNWINEMLKK